MSVLADIYRAIGVLHSAQGEIYTWAECFVPEETVTIIAAIIAALSGAGGIVAWYKARTERLRSIADASAAAVKAATEEWDTLTASQREAMAEYRARLSQVTERLTEVEHELEREKERSGLLAGRVRELEQKQEEWRLERASLLARIAELEGRK